MDELIAALATLRENRIRRNSRIVMFRGKYFFEVNGRRYGRGNTLASKQAILAHQIAEVRPSLMESLRYAPGLNNLTPEQWLSAMIAAEQRAL